MSYIILRKDKALGVKNCRHALSDISASKQIACKAQMVPVLCCAYATRIRAMEHHPFANNEHASESNYRAVASLLHSTLL